MADVDREMNERIADFVAELTQLVRDSTMAAVRAALAAGSARVGVKAALAGGARRGAARARGGGAAPRGAVRPKGAKRPPAELAATTSRLLTYVRANPGQRIEPIGAALRIPTKDLALPIKKLIAGGQVRVTGEKRATRYFADGGTGAGPAASGKRAARPARPAKKRARKAADSKPATPAA